VENPNKGLSIPAEASVRVTAEWETNGPLASRLLNSLVAIADQSPLGGARFTLTWPLLQTVTKT
jgi:hypothetical protein